MKYEQFAKRVAEELGPDGERTEKAIRAVLETLGEYLDPLPGERRHLATQLPKELAQHLLARKGIGRPFSLDAFQERVGARARVHLSRAIIYTRAVLAAMREAVAPGDWRHVRTTLSDDYNRLLDTLGFPR